MKVNILGTEYKIIFENEEKVTEMKEASFPILSMEVSGHEINRLYGYAANLDGQIIRECITPVTEDRSISVKIDEGGSDVKKLKYEIFNIDGKQKETENYTLVEGESGNKNVKIDLKENYETGSEYILKFTLITTTSKRIYYYTRIKFYENGKLDEKLEFIMNFHKTLLDTKGRRAEALMDWLEPNRNSDHSTLAEVSIKSRLNLVSYGGLDTKLIYEQLPTITEFYENYASFRLDYVIAVDTELGTERKNITVSELQTTGFYCIITREIWRKFSIFHIFLLRTESLNWESARRMR